MHRLLKENCLYCNLLVFDGVVLLDNTKGWPVGSPQEERLLMSENFKEELKRVKGHLKETAITVANNAGLDGWGVREFDFKLGGKIGLAG